MAVNKNLAGSFGNYGFLTSDNPNAWKARSEGAILSEKAYGNPAMNPANATTFADQTFKGDPWYALGRMIGAGYMQNYNERGINKNIDAANEAIKGTYGDLSGTGTQQQQPQATAQPIQYNNNVPTDYTYQGRENKGELIQPRDQMAMEKREYFVDKYSGSPNPTSDSINKANAEAQAKAEADRINGLRKVDPVMMYDLAADAIKKRGGTKYQQDMALAQIREQIGGHMASINQQIFDYDSKEAEDLINNGEYEKAWTKYQGLASRDKDRADMMYKGIPTLQQIAQMRQQRELANMKQSGYYGGNRSYNNNRSSQDYGPLTKWQSERMKALSSRKEKLDSVEAAELQSYQNAVNEYNRKYFAPTPEQLNYYQTHDGKGMRERYDAYIAQGLTHEQAMDMLSKKAGVNNIDELPKGHELREGLLKGQVYGEGMDY